MERKMQSLFLVRTLLQKNQRQRQLQPKFVSVYDYRELLSN